jgi:nucleotide-binding universal stress UspA family protein
MRVLIAIDGSKASEIVLEEALSRPWPSGTRFCLITVVDPFFFTRAPLLLEEAKGAAGKFLREAAERFGKAGWETEVEVVLGNPRRVISNCAEEWRADLVLVGSQGLRALARLAMGSTVRAVLRHTKCSVEVVRAPKKRAVTGQEKIRILVATDGSEFSTAAVKAVAERPWPKGTEVKVISVPEFALWLGEYPYFQLEQLEKVNHSALDAARDAVVQGKEILRRAGLEVSTDVPVEREAPARTILDEAKEWDADLIVVGSHGRRGFDRFALGSVSESLAMNAHCSAEVVRVPLNKELLEKKGEEHESERSHDGHAVHVS